MDAVQSLAPEPAPEFSHPVTRDLLFLLYSVIGGAKMAAMLRRRPAYNTHAQMVDAARDQTVMDYDACPAKPVEPVADQPAAEAQPAYMIKTGWVDTADRTRTWKLLGPEGTKMAEIATKGDAQGMADFLNFVDKDGHLRAQFLSRAESKSNGRGR